MPAKSLLWPVYISSVSAVTMWTLHHKCFLFTLLISLIWVVASKAGFLPPIYSSSRLCSMLLPLFSKKAYLMTSLSFSRFLYCLRLANSALSECLWLGACLSFPFSSCTYTLFYSCVECLASLRTQNISCHTICSRTYFSSYIESHFECLLVNNFS